MGSSDEDNAAMNRSSNMPGSHRASISREMRIDSAQGSRNDDLNRQKRSEISVSFANDLNRTGSAQGVTQASANIQARHNSMSVDKKSTFLSAEIRASDRSVSSRNSADKSNSPGSIKKVNEEEHNNPGSIMIFSSSGEAIRKEEELNDVVSPLSEAPQSIKSIEDPKKRRRSSIAGIKTAIASTSKKSMQSSTTGGSTDEMGFINYVKIIKESKYYRILQEWLESPQLKLCVLLLIMVICALAVVLVFSLVPGRILPSIASYNQLIVFEAMASYILIAATFEALNIISKLILASQLAKGPCTIEQLVASSSSGRIRLGDTRKTVKFLSLLNLILVIVTSLNLSWTPVDNLHTTGDCIPATYTDFTLFSPHDEGMFLQGESDFAMIYEYGLPLADGLIGGFSNWPLVSVGSAFQVQNSGPVFLIMTDCFSSEASTHLNSSTATYIHSANQIVQDNVIEGSIELFFPPGTVYNDSSRVNGTIQRCFYQIMEGTGITRMLFVADEWQMVASSSVTMITVNGVQVSQYSSVDRYASEFAASVTNDQWGITSVLASTIRNCFNHTPFESSQGSGFANIMQWATLPDTYYHEEQTYKGVAAMLGMMNHYLLLQYDGDQLASCTYISSDGSGTPSLMNAAMVPIIIATISLMFALIFANLAFIYANKGFVGPHLEVLKCLTNQIRLAHDFHYNGSALFDKLGSAYQVSNYELMETYKKSMVSYGVQLSGSQKATDKLIPVFGFRRQLIPLRKHFERQRKASLDENDSDANIMKL